MSGLIYVMGPSGCGKDSLLGYAREWVEALPVAFAHRYITRAAAAGGENHVALTRAEFEVRDNAGMFAFDWASHGYRYGIGVEIDAWLAAGMTVVLNGSRGYLETARARYSELVSVLISVDPSVLEERLRARGRESEEEIQARLQRLQAFHASRESGVIIVDNSGPLEQGGEELVRIIREQAVGTA